jgi:RimJ/RimL family protein N-acetyltransferase
MSLPGAIKKPVESLARRWRYDPRPFPIILLHGLRNLVEHNRFWYRVEKRIYVYETSRIASLPQPHLLSRDRVEDLQYYERTASWQVSPEDYREMANARLDTGDHLYTLVEGDRLLHYAWLQPHHNRGEDNKAGQVFFPPPASAALYDHYTHPLSRGRGLFYHALCQLLHDVQTMTDAKQAYIYVYADNGPSRHVIEKIGFTYVGSLIAERRLREARRYAVSAGGEFPTALLEK